MNDISESESVVGSTFGRCGKCRFWKSGGPFRDGRDGCGNLWIDDFGVCLSDRMNTIFSIRRHDEPEKSKADDAYVTPDHALLKTRADFGCTHYIPNDRTEARTR